MESLRIMDKPDNKTRKEQILMTTYRSSIGLSFVYPAIASILQVFMLIFCYTHAQLYGPYARRYSMFYITFLTASVIFIALSLFVKKDIENRYKILHYANPVFAAYSFFWALLVTFSDFGITGVLDLVLFTTYSMIIPISLFLLPLVYALIISVADVVLLVFIIVNTEVGLPIINTIIFFIFQFILGISFIRLRIRLSEKMIEEKERMATELEFAAQIQTSILPSDFPPFPERPEFELFASMNAAKEVGGDFYDYYMIGDKTLGFLVADVSGKSIPGAMFMMRGKAVIKDLAETGMSPAEVFSAANNKLCEGNDTCLFITAWMGYLDIETGVVHAVNAGHNPPVLVRDGKAEYVDFEHGMMMAAMSGMTYKEHTLQLKKGDILYLYTDGVTEAIDPDEKQYGDDRLLELLSFGNVSPSPAGANGVAGAVCETVKSDIVRFVRGAEQFDDITMLCIRYLGVTESE